MEKTGKVALVKMLFCMLIVGAFSCLVGGVENQAMAEEVLQEVVTVDQNRAVPFVDTNMISYAKTNVIRNGKWIRNKNGNRYLQINGEFVENTWCCIRGKIYCFNKNGYTKTKTFRYRGKYYYADQNGCILIKKWVKIGKNSYYYKNDGTRAVNCWRKIGKKQYYFERCTGDLVKNTWIGGRYVDKTGALVKNRTIGGRRVNKNGELVCASENDKYIIVGASRIVDMSVAVNSQDTIFIAKGGQGLDWLKNTAGPRLEAFLKKKVNYKVVFQLGNNDMWNIDGYILYYQKLIRKYPKTEFYFLDSTPGDERLNSKNSQRIVFNKRMKRVFGSRCIGGYSYLQSKGFETLDGVHYTKKVSKLLYRYIIRKITAS